MLISCYWSVIYTIFFMKIDLLNFDYKRAIHLKLKSFNIRRFAVSETCYFLLLHLKITSCSIEPRHDYIWIFSLILKELPWHVTVLVFCYLFKGIDCVNLVTTCFCSRSTKALSDSPEKGFHSIRFHTTPRLSLMQQLTLFRIWSKSKFDEFLCTTQCLCSI